MELKEAHGLMSTICKCCGHEVDNLGEHLKDSHGLNTWDYWEIGALRGDLWKSCPDCGTPRYLASPVISGFYLPCPKCASKEDMIKHMTTKIEELQKLSRTDKYFEAVLSSPGLLGCSLEHDVHSILNILRDHQGKLRSDIYLGFIWKPGYPKEISERNKGSIQRISLEVPVSKNLLVTIQDRSYQILPPETCGYDVRHHSRYSILSDGSSKSTRYTKRIRIESEICYKFWNNRGFPETKSIFRIVTPGTLDQVFRIPAPDLCILKQVILRNKTTSGILWRIYNEVLKYSRSLNDKVLLKNTLPIYPWGKVDFRFSWEPIKIISDPELNEVNISVL
jgi:hypothetical protein